MKKLTVNESLKIAMANRDSKIFALEAENAKLRELIVQLTSGGITETGEAVYYEGKRMYAMEGRGHA